MKSRDIRKRIIEAIEATGGQELQSHQLECLTKLIEEIIIEDRDLMEYHSGDKFCKSGMVYLTPQTNL